MGIAVLGPLQVDGQTNGLSPRDRVVLSALVARAGEPITTESLADALWGEELPPTWSKVLQGCVVRLRKQLGSAAIASAAHGYRLALTDEELDHKVFERLLAHARDALAGGDPARSSYLAQEALQLWRGQALPDLEDWEPGRVETTRLEGLRMEAEELLVEAETAAGRARDVVEQARALVAQAPFREQRWALLARALHQTGRQPEALGAIQRARAMLVDEFGLDPGRELVDLEARLLRQDPSLAPATSPEVSATCPYRGLLPYDAADADTFFGREDDIAACQRRLRDTGVLTVIGPSGVGKSSLVRAGVVASLLRSTTPMLVTSPGVHPMDSLVALKPRGRQTLVVDQTEEAVTLCTDPAERSRYFAALALHVGAGGALVLALRADHLGDLAPYPEIARVLEDGLYLLGPMNEAGLRRAVEGPARRAGLRLEPGLVDLLVREVEGEPAALPLLSHVLREIWERREGPTLTVAGYRATGGIRQAVSRSAESLYDAMDPAERTQLRSLLLRLVMPTEDGDPVRARVPRSKVAVDAGHERLVEQLVQARLVSIDGDTLQIAHEALVRVWPRLRGWLDDDLDGQRLFRHLAGAADAWHTMGRPDSELYRGTRLSRTLEWRERTTPDLNDTETALLDASVALSAAERRATATRVARERRVNRRLRKALAGVGVLLILALVAGILAVRAAEQARQDRSQKEATARLAEVRRAGGQVSGQDNIATGLLLAVEALKVDASAQAWDNLAAVLTHAGPLAGVRDTGGTTVSMSVSPDGKLVAISLPEDADRPGVRLFDTASLEPMTEPVQFEDHTPSSIVRFSPNGSQLAVAVNQWVTQGEPRIDDQPLRLYDLPGGRLSDRQPGGFRTGDSIEYALDYSDDGRRLAAVVQHFDRRTHHFTALGAATVWDLARPAQPIFRVPVPEAGKVALSPDGRRLYAAVPGPGTLRAYDLDSRRLIRIVDNPIRLRLGDLDLSPDGATLAVTAGDRIFRYDAGTLRPRGPVMRGHLDLVLNIDYSHDGRFLVTASRDRSAIVWDAATGALLHRFALHGTKPVQSGQLWDAEWSPDDRTIYTTDWDELIFMTWRLDQVPGLLTLGEATPAVEKDGYSVSLPAPDGHTLARMRFGRLWFLDTETGRETARSAPLPDLGSPQWSPDSRLLLSTGPDERLRVWDPATGDQVAVRQFARGGALRAAFSPDAKRVYVVDRTGQLLTLDSATLRQVYGGGVAVGSGVNALLPHPRDGSVFLLKIDGSFIRVEPETGQIVTEAPAGTMTSTFDLAGALSPDGSVLATTDPAHSLRLLDIQTLDWISPDPGVDSGANLTYAPDGSQFASVQSGRISLWDGHTGDYQASLPLPALATDVSITYRPDSSGLVIAARDGRTWTADTRTGTWVERACSIAGRNLTMDEWTQFFPSQPYHATCPSGHRQAGPGPPSAVPPVGTSSTDGASSIYRRARQ